MKTFKLDEYMTKSIEYFRKIEGLSLYGTLSAINSDNDSNKEFFHHGQKVLKYFNDFDDRIDDENFMKCWLGYYEVVQRRFKIVCPVCDKVGASVYSASIECHHCDFVEGV